MSLVACAVTLSPATTEIERINFHMLNPKTQNRLKQQLVDAETGETVDRADVIKGYEFDKDQFVVVDEAELAGIKIESTHTIDIERFVDRSEVDDLYYSKPYFMVPDGKISEEAYAVIREAMRRQGKVAIARLVLSAREHIVAIAPDDGGMSVTTLREPNEVRSAKTAFAGIREIKVDPQMVKLAESIIAEKVGPFEPKMFEDRYQAALRELVDAKQKGRKPTSPRASQPSNVVNLMDALRRSVKGARKPATSPKETTREPAKRKLSRTSARHSKAS